MIERTGASWLVYALGALCAAAILAAVLVVGPASGSQATVTRTATVAQGVVQSTVSGSGNLQAVSQLDLGFKTSGTVTHIYVTQGQQVAQGQLLATLDPQSAEVTLEQAKAALQSAEADLAKEEETDGEGSTAGSSGGAGAGNSAAASAASVSGTSAPALATIARARASAYEGAPPAATTTPASTAPAATTPTATTPTTATPTTTTTTTPTATTPAATAPSKRTAPTNTTSTTTAPRTSTTAPAAASRGTEKEKAKEKETISTATREANLASARAAVKSDTLTVQSDEQAVQNTKLYAPESGTIVSLSGQVGEVVSGSGTTKASSASSASSGSGSSGAGATGASAAGRSAADGSSASSSSSSSNSSSSFAVLSDLSSMQLVVALSESEIGNVKDGQIATVTVEALASSPEGEGRKLAAHVSEVALMSTSSSGAVSYDVTFHLDQLEAGLKLGMSATAEVVVKQAEGINVPTSAISAGSVTVERAGKQVRQRVLTGLAGNTSTIVLSGLKAGETVVLPAASSTSSSTGSLASRLGSRLGSVGGVGGLGGAGGFAGGAPGGAAFFRGGG